MRAAGLRVSIFVSMFAALAFAQPRAETPQIAHGLAARALRDGSVRVIVGVRARVVPEGRLEAQQALAQRDAIAAAQQRVIEQIAAVGADRIRRFATIPFFSARVSAAALARLAAREDVVTIEENAVDVPTLAESTAVIGATAARALGYTGAGWTVAVLDTGVQPDHPFIADAVVDEACYSNDGGNGDGISLCPQSTAIGVVRGSATYCDMYLFDGCDHGTHVAGIAAGRRDPGGAAADGVAPGATVLAMQVFTGFGSSIGSYVSDQIAALERVYVLRARLRIAAVNMSLGSVKTYGAPCDASEPSRKAIVDHLRAAGIATIVAAGNSAAATALSAPACISSAISVGSTGDGSSAQTADVVSKFSNAAPFLTLLAPGTSIMSSVPRNIYAGRSGTSMAAPHVAGAWALMKERKPLASVDEVLATLVATGTPVTDTRSGLPIVKPRIDVRRALQAVRVDYMAVDAPSSGSMQRLPFTMRGWALNMSAPPGAGPGVDTVHVWAFPAAGAPRPVGVAAYGTARGDVAAAYGAQFANSGWFIPVDALPAGTYTLNAYARNTFDGTFSQMASVRDVWVPGTPEVHIDTPASGSVVTKPFVMSGWAIDRTAPAGTGITAVHVWAYPEPGSATPPIFVGAASYGVARPDVGAAWGERFANAGWRLSIDALPAGRHQIVAHARGTGSTTFDGVQGTVVTISEPVSILDTPRNTSTVAASSPVTISGWAIDLGSTSGPGINAVHVWRYSDRGAGPEPIFVGLATLGIARADVAQIFGARFLASGYHLTTTLPTGVHRVAVFPQSAVSGQFTVRTVEVSVTAADK